MSIITKIKKRHYIHSLKDLWEYMEQLENALKGDLVAECAPATTGSSATTVQADIAGAEGKYTRDVTVSLKDSDGNIQTWFNGSLDIAVTEVTVGDGVSAIAGGLTEVQLTEGVGSVTIEYTGTWAAADTQTLTVTGGTILGYSVANKTSVDTIS